MVNSEQYMELSLYSLSRQDTSFIHQNIVDAQTAQTADETTKSIALTFALVGLYLHVEKGYTGREVQDFHLKMAKNKRVWPDFYLPKKRGDITVATILDYATDFERAVMIQKWCVSVWEVFRENRALIINLVAQYEEEHF